MGCAASTSAKYDFAKEEGWTAETAEPSDETAQAAYPSGEWRVEEAPNEWIPLDQGIGAQLLEAYCNGQVEAQYLLPTGSFHVDFYNQLQTHQETGRQCRIAWFEAAFDANAAAQDEPVAPEVYLGGEWLIEEGEGQWVRLDHEISAQLLVAWYCGEQRMDYALKGRTFEVDLTVWEHRDLETGERKRIVWNSSDASGGLGSQEASECGSVDGSTWLDPGEETAVRHVEPCGLHLEKQQCHGSYGLQLPGEAIPEKYRLQLKMFQLKEQYFLLQLKEQQQELDKALAQNAEFLVKKELYDSTEQYRREQYALRAEAERKLSQVEESSRLETEALQQKMSEALAQLAMLKADCKRLNAEKEVLQTQLQDTPAQWEQREKLQQRLQEALAQPSKLQARLSILEERCARLEEEKESLQKQSGEALAKTVRLQDSHALELQKCQLRLEEALAQPSNLKANLSKLEERCAQLEKEKESLQKQFEVTEARFLKLQDSQALEQQKHQQQLEEALSQPSKLRTKLLNLEKHCAQLEKDKQCLQKQSEFLKVQLQPNNKGNAGSRRIFSLQEAERQLFMALNSGQPVVRYNVNGCEFEVDVANMVQTNLETGERWMIAVEETQTEQKGATDQASTAAPDKTETAATEATEVPPEETAFAAGASEPRQVPTATGRPKAFIYKAIPDPSRPPPKQKKWSLAPGGHRPRLAPKGAKASAKPKSGPNGNIGEELSLPKNVEWPKGDKARRVAETVYKDMQKSREKPLAHRRRAYMAACLSWHPDKNLKHQEGAPPCSPRQIDALLDTADADSLISSFRSMLRGVCDGEVLLDSGMNENVVEARLTNAPMTEWPSILDGLFEGASFRPVQGSVEPFTVTSLLAKMSDEAPNEKRPVATAGRRRRPVEKRPEDLLRDLGELAPGPKTKKKSKQAKIPAAPKQADPTPV
eukprot:g17230.t1